MYDDAPRHADLHFDTHLSYISVFVRIEDESTEKPDHLHKVINPDVCRVHQHVLSVKLRLEIKTYVR